MGADPAQASGQRYRRAPGGPTRYAWCDGQNRRARRVCDADAAVDDVGEAAEDHVDVTQAVDHVEQSPVGEPGQQRGGLGLVQGQAPPDGLLGVIGPPPRQHAGRDLVDRDVQVHRSIQGRTCLCQEHLHRGCLVGGAGIAVEEEAVLGDVGLGEALGHDPVDQVVTHQVAGVHQGPGLQAQLGPGGHRGAQHVAGGDVDRAVGLDEPGRLCALSRPLAAEDDEMDCGHDYLRKPS
jgi:hypothetical protein